MIKNKKGSLTDVIFGPASILAIILTFFIAVYVWDSFNTTFQATMVSNLNNETQILMNQSISNISIGLNTIDYIMPIIVAGLLLVSLIFAFKTGASVIYAILSIILWVLALIMSAIFTNIYLQVDESLGMGTTFIISNFLMTNMKWIVLGWLALISIVIFSRNKSETEAISSSERVFR